MKRNRLIPLVILIFIFFFAACLGPTDPIEQPNIFSLTNTLLNIGEDFVLGQDTISVLGYKMLIDTISVMKQGMEDEHFEPELRLVSFIAGFADYNTVGMGELGAGRFEGIGYSIIRPVPAEVDLIDPDLVERDHETGEIIDVYSVAVLGLYNNELFRFRSKVSQNVKYGFLEVIEMPEYNGYLEARLRGNWKQWFLNAERDQLLNPNDPANREQIEENFLKHFDIFTITVGGV